MRSLPFAVSSGKLRANGLNAAEAPGGAAEASAPELRSSLRWDAGGDSDAKKAKEDDSSRWDTPVQGASAHSPGLLGSDLPICA